jgi:hypothetical protein
MNFYAPGEAFNPLRQNSAVRNIKFILDPASDAMDTDPDHIFKNLNMVILRQARKYFQTKKKE